MRIWHEVWRLGLTLIAWALVLFGSTTGLDIDLRPTGLALMIFVASRRWQERLLELARARRRARAAWRDVETLAEELSRRRATSEAADPWPRETPPPEGSR